jgi:L-fucose dehydrogenase
MNLNLKEKIIVISGGASGIGEAIVSQLALEGAYPVIIDKNEEQSKVVLEKISAAGSFGYAITADLANPEACKTAIDEVLARFDRIDGLVNNAGKNDSISLENGTYDDFIASYHLNAVHYFLLAKYALSALKLSKGNILNISSKVAETGQGGTSGYAASCGARNALTREWAVELAPYNIRVNAIIVAEVYTPMYQNWIEKQANAEEKLREIQNKIPLGNRFTAAEEIANTACFLLSNRSSHTTGQLVHVDGGYVHLDR